MPIAPPPTPAPPRSPTQSSAPLVAVAVVLIVVLARHDPSPDSLWLVRCYLTCYMTLTDYFLQLVRFAAVDCAGTRARVRVRDFHLPSSNFSGFLPGVRRWRGSRERGGVWARQPFCSGTRCVFRSRIVALRE